MHTAAIAATAVNVFDAAPSELIAALQTHGETQQLSRGSVLIREGDCASDLFIVTAGAVAVATRSADGQTVLLGQGRRGTLLGDMSWLERRPAVATVSAEQDCQVLRVAHAALERLLREAPGIAAALYRLIGTKLCAQIQSQNSWIHRFNASQQEPLRKVLMLFAELNDEDVDWLRQLGQLQRLGPGEVLIDEGDPVPALYLVLAGDARIAITSDGTRRQVGSSRRGEVLGEMTLLSLDQGGASALVESADGLEVLRLDKGALLAALAASPQRAVRFWCALARMLSQRSREQLLERGLAAASHQAEQQDDDEELDLAQLSAISAAGARFDWLCRQFQNQEG